MAHRCTKAKAARLLVMKAADSWEHSQRFIDSEKASWDLLQEFLHREIKELFEYAREGDSLLWHGWSATMEEACQK